MVTTGVATIGAIACITAIYRHWKILPPAQSLGRSLFVTIVTFALAILWATPGWMLLLKLAIASLLIPCVLLLLGEFSDRERGAINSYIQSAFQKYRGARL
jgi:hypothetical protein